MRFQRFAGLFVAASIAAAVAMGQIVPVGQDHSGAPPPSAALDGAAPASAMDAVLAAGDPSAAIAAYSRAVAQGAGGVDLLNAFVVRMVELGAPEAAHVQARELISAVPNHGLAWAVVAAASALDGDMTLALSEVAAAVRFAPDEPFVQHMAGEMVAWYDAEGRESSLADSLRGDVENVRAAMAGREIFAEVYAQASGAGVEPPIAESAPRAEAPAVVEESPALVEEGAVRIEELGEYGEYPADYDYIEDYAYEPYGYDDAYFEPVYPGGVAVYGGYYGVAPDVYPYVYYPEPYFAAFPFLRSYISYSFCPPAFRHFGHVGFHRRIIRRTGLYCPFGFAVLPRYGYHRDSIYRRGFRFGLPGYHARRYWPSWRRDRGWTSRFSRFDGSRYGRTSFGRRLYTRERADRFGRFGRDGRFDRFDRFDRDSRVGRRSGAWTGRGTRGAFTRDRADRFDGRTIRSGRDAVRSPRPSGVRDARTRTPRSSLRDRTGVRDARTIAPGTTRRERTGVRDVRRPAERSAVGRTRTPRSPSVESLRQRTPRSVAPSGRSGVRSIAPSQRRTPRTIAPSQRTTPRSIAPSQRRTPRSMAPSQRRTPRSIAPSQRGSTRSMAPSQRRTPRSIAPSQRSSRPRSIAPSRRSAPRSLAPSRGSSRSQMGARRSSSGRSAIRSSGRSPSRSSGIRSRGSSSRSSGIRSGRGSSRSSAAGSRGGRSRRSPR